MSCSEARTSLRESLKIFRAISQKLNGSQVSSFEMMCFQYSNKVDNQNVYQFSNIDDVSCGNFVKCFTSLFIEKKQITRNVLNQIIDGGALTQYFNHLNILMYNQQEYNTHHTKLSSSNRKHISSVSQSIANWKSIYECNSLSRNLLDTDAEQLLPRIFILQLLTYFHKYLRICC
jgi:hypothetical protein